MPHLFTPLREASPLNDWLRRLTAVHDAVARVAAAHQDVVDTVDHWGCIVKRRPLDLSGLATDDDVSGIIGVTSHPFGEVVNQLATVERLLDALRWAETNGAERVVECNPSTSRAPAGTCSHDRVVAGPGTTMVFEVSDVAGVTGNANHKMEKDLMTLDSCSCGAGSVVRRLLAVSPQSGLWLEARPELAAVVAAVRNGSGTWIVERRPGGD
jgi:hypothetical protein